MSVRPTVPGRAPDEAAARRAAWYNEAKFGLFVHWGLYSVPARARPGQLAEWVMNNEAIPVAEYERFARVFTAARFDPDAWVRAARDCQSLHPPPKTPTSGANLTSMSVRASTSAGLKPGATSSSTKAL